MAGADQFAAHLDRGWDRYGRGDLKGAERSARQALALEQNHPEALHLLGTAQAAQGRADEAMESFRAAMAEDDGYLDPILAAAELALFSLGDPDECVRLCEDVLSFAEEPEDRADAALLKIDALIERGDEAEAREALDEVPAGIETAPLLYRLGRACFDLDALDRAERHLRAAVAKDPALADARYELGRLLSERGDEPAAREELLEAHALDAASPPPPGSMPPREFRELAERARASLPEGIRALLGGAPLTIAGQIGAELVAEGLDPRAACFFAGRPAGEAEDAEALGVSPEPTTGDDAYGERRLSGRPHDAEAAGEAPAEPAGGGRRRGAGAHDAEPAAAGGDGAYGARRRGARVRVAEASLERIFVYPRPLELRPPPGQLEAEVRAALLAEAALFFGLSDRDLALRGVSPDEL